MQERWTNLGMQCGKSDCEGLCYPTEDTIEADVRTCVRCEECHEVWGLKKYFRRFCPECGVELRHLQGSAYRCMECRDIVQLNPDGSVGND